MTDTLDTGADLTSATIGTLIVSGGASALAIRGADLADRLHRGLFRGLIPAVDTDDGTVSIRYRRRVHPFTIERGDGDIELSTRVPWHLQFRDGAALVTADLTGLDLLGLSFEGSVADITLQLPRPNGVVAISIDGASRNLSVSRPAGVPVAVRIDGGATRLHIDGDELSAVGRGYRTAAPSAADHYVLSFAGGVDGLIVTGQTPSPESAIA
jgi:hypothetical protein